MCMSFFCILLSHYSQELALPHFHPLSLIVSSPQSVSFLITVFSFSILHIFTKFLWAAGAADLWSDHVTTYTRACAKSVQSVKLCNMSYHLPLWLCSFTEASQIPDKNVFWRLSATAISHNCEVFASAALTATVSSPAGKLFIWYEEFIPVGFLHVGAHTRCRTHVCISLFYWNLASANTLPTEYKHIFIPWANDMHIKIQKLILIIVIWKNCGGHSMINQDKLNKHRFNDRSHTQKCFWVT